MTPVQGNIKTVHNAQQPIHTDPSFPWDERNEQTSNTATSPSWTEEEVLSLDDDQWDWQQHLVSDRSSTTPERALLSEEETAAFYAVRCALSGMYRLNNNNKSDFSEAEKKIETLNEELIGASISSRIWNNSTDGDAKIDDLTHKNKQISKLIGQDRFLLAKCRHLSEQLTILTKAWQRLKNTS